MRRQSMIFALGLVLQIILACTRVAQTPGTLTDQDLAALREIAARDAPIVRARDWTTLTAEYAEDAVRMPPNGPAVGGRDAIRKMLEQTPPLSAFDFRLVDLKGDGNLAYMHGTWSMSLTPPGGTKAVSDFGKILVVLRKQPDGSWLRVADAWNSDVSPTRANTR